jgi:hypothetical protein
LESAAALALPLRRWSYNVIENGGDVLFVARRVGGWVLIWSKDIKVLEAVGRTRSLLGEGQGVVAIEGGIGGRRLRGIDVRGLERLLRRLGVRLTSRPVNNSDRLVGTYMMSSWRGVYVIWGLNKTQSTWVWVCGVHRGGSGSVVAHLRVHLRVCGSQKLSELDICQIERHGFGARFLRKGVGKQHQAAMWFADLLLGCLVGVTRVVWKQVLLKWETRFGDRFMGGHFHQ